MLGSRQQNESTFPASSRLQPANAKATLLTANCSVQRHSQTRETGRFLERIDKND
jgi:hypothetical protein